MFEINEFARLSAIDVMQEVAEENLTTGPIPEEVLAQMFDRAMEVIAYQFGV